MTTARGHSVSSPALLHEACLLASLHDAGLRGRLPTKRLPKGLQEPFPETSGGGRNLHTVPLPCSRAPDSPEGALSHVSGDIPSSPGSGGQGACHLGSHGTVIIGEFLAGCHPEGQTSDLVLGAYRGALRGHMKGTLPLHSPSALFRVTGYSQKGT